MNTDPDQQNSPLILVVDDDKSMRMLLRLALEQEGYNVLEAEDGRACLAAYQRRQPDAILLDAVMPFLFSLFFLKMVPAYILHSML